MPPKKRKSEAVEEEAVSTDEERTINKRGRIVASNSDDKLLKYDLKWEEHGDSTCDDAKLKPLFYIYSKNLSGCSKIAGFDIDMTVIKTKSGKTFPTNVDDWTWFDKCVPEKLKELNSNGYRVIFFTNQGGIEKKRVQFSELKSKFEKMIIQIDIPIFVYIATGENHFRKPSTGMWDHFTKHHNSSVEINMKESFFVGDAAGRQKNWAPGKKKDFSCADRMFADNIKINFHTPEEFFLSQKKVPFLYDSINPEKVLETTEKLETKYHSDIIEMIIMIGLPASGKSTFSKKYFLPFGYVHINRDILKTQEKCLKEAENNLKEGKSVVIDNTNPTKKSRADYINLAKKLKINQIRCFHINTPLDLCHHLNYVRQNQTQGRIRRIPDVGYHTFTKYFEKPEKSEGFSEITSINFVPSFDSELNEKIFKQWTN